MARPYRQNRVRIIGGDWRGRLLQVADSEGLRPTGDRIRETLFNWLQPHAGGARCLDLFAGSGVLGIEAVSRGAAQALLVENEPRAAAALRDSTAAFAHPGLRVIERDVHAFLTTPAEACDLVFVDPPFAAVAHYRCLAALGAGGWLKPGARIYVESAENTAPPIPSGWQLLREGRAGQVRYALYTP